MYDGFYSLYYTGLTGSGFGMLVLRRGQIIGADVTGGTYDGTYEINPDNKNLEGRIRMIIPQGVPLVTGTSASPHAYTLEFPITLPAGFSDAKPIEIRIPTGPVNIAVKKLRTFPNEV